MNSTKFSKKQEKFDYLCKSIIVGDSGVGKTNIVLRFTQDYYKNSHVATIGVDFKVKTLNIDGIKIKLQVWDTAGQCKFRNITKTYFKGAIGAIFTYAIDDKNSFKNIEQWIRQANDSSDIEQVRMLIGNKSDILQQNRMVKTSQGQQLAKKYNMYFMEVSAKNGRNINEAFMQLGKQIKKIVKQEQSHVQKIDKNNLHPKQKCCK